MIIIKKKTNNSKPTRKPQNSTSVYINKKHWEKSNTGGSEVSLTIKSSGAGLSLGCFFILRITKENIHI